MSELTFKKLPGVLAFQRGVVISDALFFNVCEDSQTPVMVVRHGIRGTQNVNKDGDAEKSTAANAKRQEVSNIQTTDTAKLDANAQALAVRFSLRFLDLDNVLFACAPSSTDADDLVRQYRDSVASFIERAKTSDGLNEVAARFARNIANGRWLWRNRTIARQITVRVSVAGKALASFDALATPLNHFNDISADERKVAAYIADGLRGDDDAGLDIEAQLDFGVRGALDLVLRGVGVDVQGRHAQVTVVHQCGLDQLLQGRVMEKLLPALLGSGLARRLGRRIRRPLRVLRCYRRVGALVVRDQRAATEHEGCDG